MKRLILPLLLSLVYSISFSQDMKTLGDKKNDIDTVSCRDARFARVPDCANTVYYDEGQEAVFHKRSGKPFTGDCKTCYINDNLEMFLHFKNGKSDGVDTVYYENGRINLIRSHFDGKEDGSWMFYTEDGHLKWQKNFNGGQPHGQHIYYYLDGTIQKTETWEYGNLTGVKKEFYPGENGIQGKVKKEVHYKDGKFHGMYITYFENGQVESEQNYVMDQKDGLSKYYYDDGKLFYTENYDKGVLNGQIKRLYKNGNIWMVQKFKKGEPTGVWEEYYPEGMIRYEGEYKKGKLVKEHYYNRDGDEMASPPSN